MLRVRLRHLDAENFRRRQLAALYARELAASGLVLPPQPGAALPVFHQYAIRTPGRERLRLWLETRDIAAQALYPVALHRQPAFAKWAPAEPDPLAECGRCCA